MSEKKSSRVETTTLERVPAEERKNWIDIALIQAGIMICVPSLMLGGILAQSMAMSTAILSGVTGYLITVALFSLMGLVGSDLGVPTCVAAFGGFGRQGSRLLISALLMISMIGWFAVQTSVCGAAFSNLIAQFTGVQVPSWMSMIFWGAVMLLTAVYGINALDNLNKIAVPALVIITMVGCMLALRQYGTEKLLIHTSEPTMSFWDGVALTISFMAAGSSTAPDITRYQKTRKDTILSTSIGVMPAGMAMLIMGAVMTRIADQYDVTLVFCQIGIPVVGMLVLIMATWTTNTTNAYCAGLDAVLLLHLKDDKRAAATMVMGAAGTVLAVVGIANYFENFLYVIGDTFTPMMGVMLADYWIVGKGKASDWSYMNGWNISGLAAWILGTGATVLIPLEFSFAIGLGVAFGGYILLSGWIKQERIGFYK